MYSISICIHKFKRFTNIASYFLRKINCEMFLKIFKKWTLLKCLMKHHDICSGCQSVSPLKSTLYQNGGMAISRIINCSRVPLVVTISFDELCITGLRRYLNRIEFTYFVKISNIFPHIPLLIFTLLLKPIVDPSHRLKKQTWIHTTFLCQYWHFLHIVHRIG